MTPRLVIAALAVAAGCGPAVTPTDDRGTSPIDKDIAGQWQRAGVDYSRPDVERAIAYERDKLTALDRDREATDDDVRLIAMTADRRVLAGAVVMLERCLADATACPPALATTPAPDVDFDAKPAGLDVAGWRIVVSRLHVAACGCRTMACVDGYTELLRLHEAANESATNGDDAASATLTAARECLFTLRGKRAR